MSSIKTRKHYVVFDMAFSGLWSFFYFVTFVYMCVAWSKTEDIKFSFASSNIIGAIFFAFVSVFAWVDIYKTISTPIYHAILAYFSSKLFKKQLNKKNNNFKTIITFLFPNFLNSSTYLKCYV